MVSQLWTSLLLAAVTCTQHVVAANPKIALAHFMVEETWAYTVAQWKTDISAAQQIGLDGFALNWKPPGCQNPPLDWLETQIGNAYTAAQNTGFKLILSFDMSYYTCGSSNWNEGSMASIIEQYYSNPAQLTWGGVLSSRHSQATTPHTANLSSSLSHPASKTRASQSCWLLLCTVRQELQAHRHRPCSQTTPRSMDT